MQNTFRRSPSPLFLEKAKIWSFCQISWQGSPNITSIYYMLYNVFLLFLRIPEKLGQAPARKFPDVFENRSSALSALFCLLGSSKLWLTGGFLFDTLYSNQERYFPRPHRKSHRMRHISHYPQSCSLRKGNTNYFLFRFLRRIYFDFRVNYLEW